MTRALFVTTATTEPIENVDAWANTMGPANHVTFDINGPPNDGVILSVAKTFKPDVIFYTGGVSGDGLPSDDTLRALRKIAPSVILQGDMADPPWWPVLKHYRAAGCFDLMVGMDGADAPVDHITLTPFDLAKFERPWKKTLHCGFAGNHVAKPRWELLKEMHGTEDLRSSVLHGLGDIVRLRERELAGDYNNYIAFLRRCLMIVNTSWAGSGLVHHMKGRLLEAAFSGTAVLEMARSPIHRWFPPDSYFVYDSVAEAREVITTVPAEEIAERAAKFAAHARKHYNPGQIYAGIMRAL